VRLANFFLSTGTIATLEGQTVPTQTFSAEASKAINTTSPLVVLVNGGTAGPAEIVAAALQDDGRGELVGERTFGEGSVQKTFDLPDGGAVILSVAKYAEPDGKKIEDDAVTPKTLVASAQADEDDTGAKTSTPQPDDQLAKALEMLKAKAA
ncbi:MAG: S41 family peptidase, partial [Gemmataceae bacterium]